MTLNEEKEERFRFTRFTNSAASPRTFTFAFGFEPDSNSTFVGFP